MRVCHLIHELGPGGAEHVLVDLARVAPAAGIEMRVLSLMPLGEHRYPRLLRDSGRAGGLARVCLRGGTRAACGGRSACCAPTLPTCSIPT